MIGLIDRVIRLSHPSFHKENFEHVINTLLDNGYPLKLIFSNIKHRLSFLFSKLNNRSIDTPNVIVQEIKEKFIYFYVPYIPEICDKFKYLFNKNSNIRVTYTNLNKLSKFINA